MGNRSNIIGEAGELECSSELMNPVSGRGILFRPIPLGSNEPTADFLVFLLSPDSEEGSQFFFLQVKTTEVGLRRDGNYSYNFPSKDVLRAQAMKVPFFVCVVDRSNPNVRQIFIKGVDSKKPIGIYRVAPLYDLTSDATKIALYEEVRRIWANQSSPVLRDLI